MLEQVVERIEENLEVGVGETGALGESRRDINLGGVEGIGHDVFVTHGAFLVGVLLFGDGTAE